MIDTRFRSALYIIFGSSCLGVVGIIQRLVPDTCSPLLAGAFRVTGGAVVLLLWGMITKMVPSKNDWPILPTVCAALGLIVFQIVFFLGIEKVGIALGTAISMGFVPIVAGLFAIIVYRENVSIQWIVYTFLAVIGIACISIFNKKCFVNQENIIIPCVAGVAYALFLIASKVLIRYHHAESVMTIIFTISAIVLSPVFFFEPFTTTHSGVTILLTILHLAIVITVIAFTFIVMGLRKVPLSTAATLSLSICFISVILGITFLEIHISMQILFGLILLFFSTVLLLRLERMSL